MRHRLMMGRYKEIDYISSTGHVNNNTNPYLDTKCILSSDFTFKISYMVVSDNSAFMFGGRTAYNSNDELLHQLLTLILVYLHVIAYIQYYIKRLYLKQLLHIILFLVENILLIQNFQRENTLFGYFVQILKEQVCIS